VEPLLDALAQKLARREFTGAEVAIEALARIGDGRAVPALLALASDRHAWEPSRQAAISSLGELGDVAAVPALGAIMLDRSEDRALCRGTAARALGVLGGPEALALLCRQADRGDGGDEFWTTSEAATALGWVGGPSAQEALLRLLLHYHSGYSAAAALGRIGDPALVPRLVSLLEAQSGRPGDGYAHVVEALSRIADPSAGRALVATLPLAMGDQVWCHARALAHVHADEAQQALLGLLAPGQVPWRRRAAARCLGEGGDAAIAFALRLVEADPDPEVRRNAIAGFSYGVGGRHPLGQDVWARWLAHGDPVVRAAATEMLATRSELFDRGFTVERLIAATRDGAVPVRLAVAGMGASNPLRIRDAALFAAYVGLLDDSDPGIRVAVARDLFHVLSMGQDLPAAEVTGLVDRLMRVATADPSPRVRAEAAVSAIKSLRILTEHPTAVRMRDDLVGRRAEISARRGSDPDPRVRSEIGRVLDARDYANIDVKWQETAPEPSAPDGF
jgi:HEAT repeat protein